MECYANMIYTGTQRYQLHVGDCREVLPPLNLGAHAVVCDPPYGLKFMGKGWDHGVPAVDFWSVIKSAVRPGAFLLAFGGTRTFHRLTVAIEDAGWEIRDVIMWVYGSGFAKSLNLEGEHNGFGTALKPAWEPIIVARAPLTSTVEANMRDHGTGALNIDACRVATEDARVGSTVPNDMRNDGFATGHKPADAGTAVYEAHPAGRWPANLIHDGSPEVTGLFPSEAGAAAPVTLRHGDKFRNAYGEFKGNRDEQGSTFHGDCGSAARFYYCAKASTQDREEGLDALLNGVLARSCQAQAEAARGNVVSAGSGAFNLARIRKNTHPTVKPTDLMRYLCRLVCPPGGTILDPFMGSGSTGKAAMLEGFRFVGIDVEPDYLPIAAGRIQCALEQNPLGI